MIGQVVSISLETYEFLIDKENLGEAHPALIGGKLWYPPDLRHNREERVLDELREQGLTYRNRVSDDFVDVLTVMQRPAVEYYTLASDAEGRINHRTASLGNDALLISNRFGGRIAIEPIPYDQLRVRLAAALPATPAARVHSAACSLEDLQAVYDGKAVPSSNSGRDAKRIHRWLEQEQLASGELHVALRDGVKGVRATDWPVPLWIDTEEGRAVVRRDADWVTLAGADLMAISELLSTMEEALRR